MKISTAIKDYLVEIEIRKYSDRTIETAKSKLKLFNAYCVEELDTNDIEDVTPQIVKRYTQHMTRRGLKGTTINGTLKTLKSFIQYCYEEEYGGFNTKRGGFKYVQQEKPIIRAFTRRDIKLILDNCKGLDFLATRDTAFLTLLFETGVRCSEARNIKYSDIKEDYILINGKGSKQRVVPITPILKKAMLRYERTADSYFLNKNIDDAYFLSRNGKKLNNSAVLHMMKRRGKDIKDIRVSPHTCRHFFAQQQVKMGTDLYTISRLLGHENIAITQIYLNSLRNEDLIKLTKGNSVLMNM